MLLLTIHNFIMIMVSVIIITVLIRTVFLRVSVPYDHLLLLVVLYASNCHHHHHCDQGRVFLSVCRHLVLSTGSHS